MRVRQQVYSSSNRLINCVWACVLGFLLVSRMDMVTIEASQCGLDFCGGRIIGSDWHAGARIP